MCADRAAEGKRSSGGEGVFEGERTFLEASADDGLDVLSFMLSDCRSIE